MRPKKEHPKTLLERLVGADHELMVDLRRGTIRVTTTLIGLLVLIGGGVYLAPYLAA
jgi:hypothetical protein